MQPTAVEYQAAAKSGGTFYFTAKKAVKLTQAGVLKAVTGSHLTGPVVTISGADVTLTAKAVAAQPDRARLPTRSPSTRHATPNDVSISSVGPTWGTTVSQKAEQALVYFFLLLALYLSIRFEAKMAAAAIIAVIHDIIFTVACTRCSTSR